MCPPASKLRLHNVVISHSWSDEKIVRFLAMWKLGDPIPQNAVSVDCSSDIDPRKAPGGLWYLTKFDNDENSNRKEDMGYWKPVISSLIRVSPDLVGLKVNLEFYEQQAPFGSNSGWAMEEYKLGLHNVADVQQEFKSLCTVFWQGDKKLNAGAKKLSLNSGVYSDLLIYHPAKPGELKLAKKSKHLNWKLHEWSQEFHTLAKAVNEALNEAKRQISTMKKKSEIVCDNYLTFSSEIKENSIKELIAITARNENVLVYLDDEKESLQKQLSLNPDEFASFCSKHKELLEQQKMAGRVIHQVHILFKGRDKRFYQEQNWIIQFTGILESLLGKLFDQEEELTRIEKSVNTLLKATQGIPSRANESFSQLFKWHSKSYLRTLKAVKKINSEMAVKSNILGDKTTLSHRYTHGHEISMKKNIAEANVRIQTICTDIDDLTKKYGLVFKPQCREPKKFLHVEKELDVKEFIAEIESFKDCSTDQCFSWRKRLFRNREILSRVRYQGPDECSYYSSCSAFESLLKREYVCQPTILKDITGQDDEFKTELSRENLKDLVENFIEEFGKQRKGQLDNCFEMLQTNGVVSENAYLDPHDQDYTIYRIAEFSKLKVDEVIAEEAEERSKFESSDEAFTYRTTNGPLQSIRDRIRDGKVAVGVFRITKEYFHLRPHDIYEVPKGPNVEYERSGNKRVYTHAVVIVGFGVRDGRSYFIYQNSYGPCWGYDGFGRVFVDSISELYTVDVKV